MTPLQTFLDAGASSVAGSLVYRQQNVGFFRDGDLHLTDAGKDALKRLDAKPAPKPKPQPAPKPKPGRKCEAGNPSVAAAAEATDTAQIDIEELLQPA